MTAWYYRELPPKGLCTKIQRGLALVRVTNVLYSRPDPPVNPLISTFLYKNIFFASYFMTTVVLPLYKK